MTKRINKKLIAFGLIAILVAVILLSALLLLLPNSNTNAVEGFNSIGQVLDVTTNDGKVEESDKVTPSEGMVAISNGTELDNFMNGTATYGYLTKDVTINHSGTNLGLDKNTFGKDRVLDGNGFKITIENNGCGWTSPSFQPVTFGDGDDAITNHWYTGKNLQSTINVLGGFIGINKGTIKNVIFDYKYLADAKYDTLGSAATSAHYIGIIAGLNMGYFSNIRLNISGQYIGFHRNSANTNGGNNNMAVVGGLAALNMGEIDGVTVDIAETVEFNVNSKTHDGYATHAVLGGVVGKMLSYKGSEQDNYITESSLRDVTMLGSGKFTISGEGGNEGYGSILNEVGIVVGSNSVSHLNRSDDALYKDCGANYSDGIIDGVLMANTAYMTPTGGAGGDYGSQGNHTSGTAQHPVLDCGKLANVFYAYDYKDRVTNCTYTTSHQTHNAQKYSVVALRNMTSDIDLSKFTINVGIDRASNEASGNAGDFNIFVSVAANQDAPSEYVIFRMDCERYSFDKEGNPTRDSVKPLGGINHTDADGNITFWNDESPINRKKGGGIIAENRVNLGTENLFTNTYIDLGQTAKITTDEATQPTAGSDYVLDYDGNAVNFKAVKDSDPSQNIYQEGSELVSNAVLTSDKGKPLDLSLREAKMPGVYNDAKIVSSLNENYGYINLAQCLVAPVNDIQSTVGEGHTMRISPVKLTIDNLNNEDTIYKAYTFNLKTSFDTTSAYVKYTANGGIQWNDTTMNPSFPMQEGMSSPKEGFSVSFAVYSSYSYSVGVNDKVEVIVAVTEETVPRKLIIDVDAPEITYVDADGSAIDKPDFDAQSWSSAKQMLRFKASDAISEIKSVTVFDGDKTTTITATNGIYSVDIGNSKERVITITDDLDNVFTDTVRYKVDTAPVLDIPDSWSIKDQTFNKNQTITFALNQLGSECIIVMRTRVLGSQSEWVTETIELDENNQYTLSKQGAYEYKFNAVNKSGQESSDNGATKFTLTINKTAIVLTNEDILYDGKLLSDSASVGVSKEYDGTTALETDDFARFAWNPSSPNYGNLKELSFTAQYVSADKGPSNTIIITPIDANGGYEFTGSIEWTKASIMPKNLTIQINNATKAYGDLNPTFSYDILGLIAGDSLNVTIDLTTEALPTSSVGKYNIIIAKSKDEINNELKDTNYTVSVINSGTLTINSKNLDGDYRITNSQVGANYTGSPVEVTAEYLFNGVWAPLEVRYYRNGEQLQGAPVNVGTYTCELFIADPNYSFTTTPKHEFTIHKAEVGIYIEEIGVGNTKYTVTYNGDLASLNIKIDNGDTENYSYVFKDANGNVLEKGQPIDAGNYKIEVSYTAVDQNFKNTFKSFDFIIEKADFSELGVKFNNVKAEYNGFAHAISVTLPEIDIVTKGTTVVLRDAQGNLYYDNTYSATNTGTYKITATISNPNFETLELTAQLEIHRTILDEVKFVNTDAVYDGTEHKMSLEGLPEGITVTLSYKGDGDVKLDKTWISAVNAGNYLVTATITGDNYETKILTGTLKIARAVLPYTFDNNTVNYDGKEHIIRPIVPDGIGYELTLSQTGEANVDGEIKLDGDGYYFSATRPNTYVVRLFINDSNYQQVSVTRTLNIKKLSLDDAIFTSGYAVTYEPNKEYLFTITSNIEGVKFTVSCDKADIIGDDNTLTTYKLPGAGTYRFTVTASKEFYEVYSTVATVTIYEADMPIRFAGATVHTYDGTDILVSLLGLPEGAEINWKTPDGVTLNIDDNTFSVRNSGKYTVTAEVTAPNYKAKAISHTITVYDALMPDEMINSIKNQTFKYDGVGKVFEVVGAPEGAEISINITDKAGNIINPIDGANKYLILLPDEYTISVTVTADNYQDYTKTITWLVLNGDMNITAENQTYKYDGTDKSVELIGVPEGATVSFVYNGEEMNPIDGRYIFTQTEVSDYVVTYRVEMEHYNSVSGEMRLSIIRNDFGDVVIPNKVFTYTGGELKYDITEYLPKGAEVEYGTLENGITREGNILKVTDVKLNHGLVSGYKVTVTLTQDNYEAKEITFTIKVERQNFEVVVNDKTVTFNNNAHSLDITGVPEGATVTYTYGNETKDSFSATRAGQYYVTITVTKDSNYNDFSRTVLLTINKATLPQFYFGAHEFQWEPNHEDFVVNVVDAEGNNIDLSNYEIIWSHKNGNVFNNAGTYRLSATYKLKGFENDYEVGHILSIENAKAIDVVVKAKKITDNIYIDSADKTFDGKALSVDIHNLPEGATVVWSTPKSYVNAGSYTVTALVSMPNYETREVYGFVTIKALEVDIQYFVKPSYIAGETPRVVGRYTDVDGNVIDFTVDTTSLRRAEEGEHKVTVKKLDSDNYKAKEACNTVTIVIGELTGTNNLGAIIGGSAGGAVALGGGIAALVVILMKKKSIKL